MFIQGLGGMNRRMYDGGMQYAHNAGAAASGTSSSAWPRGALGLFQLPFIVNFFSSIKWGAAVGQESVGGDDARVVGAVAARTRQLPDRAGRVSRAVRIQRAGRREGLHAAVRAGEARSRWNIPYTVEARPDTGLANGKLGIWLFLASEVMLFGALFSTYIILRVGAAEWPHGELNVWLGMVNTFILIGSSVTMVMAWASLKLNDCGKHRLYLLLTFVLAARLPREQVLRVRGPLRARAKGPWHSTFLAIYFTLTGLHGLHILGGMVVMAVFPRARARSCGRRTRSSSRTASSTRACTGTSSTWCGSSCSRCCICCRQERSRHAFGFRSGSASRRAFAAT